MGNVLLWASILLAIGWIWLTIGQEDMGLIYLSAGIVVLVGVGARYVLGGGR